MKNPDPNILFQEQLNILKRQYRESFPEKIRELEICCHGLEQGQEDQAMALARNAHKLAGSAGSYGYPDISQHALALCDLVEEAVSNDEIKLAKSRTQINLQTERLCNALREQQHVASESILTVEKS